MFALIHKNKIQVGPRDWHYWFFRRYLEDNDLDYGPLPLLYSEPIITNEWRIIPISELIEPEYNPLFQEYAGPYWTIYDTYITGYYDVVQSPINIIKSRMKDIISNTRYEIEIGGINFTFPDNTTVELYTTREDRSVYLDALLVMGENDTIDFKFKKGVFKTVTKQVLQQIVATGFQHIKNLFIWEASICSQIDAASTVDELKVINLNYIT